jgi:hypothetical protein
MFDSLVGFLGIIPKYPIGTKLLLASWLIFSSIVVIAAVYTYPGKGDGSSGSPAGDLQSRIADTISKALAIDKSLLEKYSDVIGGANAGVIRLLGAPDDLEKLGLRGGGSYYSFVRRDHRYGFGSDIKNEKGTFKVGFAGIDFGYFLQLGPRPIRLVIDTAGPSAPAWLEASKREAWNFLWTFKPPSTEAEARSEKNPRSRRVGDASISATAPILSGHSYLLRSISYRDSDVLVAVYVEAIDQSSGDCIIVWRILNAFDVPNAS